MKLSAAFQMGLLLFLLASNLWGQSEAEKAAANPIAKKLSFDYQSVFNFGLPGISTPAYAGALQPVLPVTIGPVNIINRPILPIIGLPKFRVTGDDFILGGLPVPPDIPPSGTLVDAAGLGDLTYQLMLSPAKPGRVIWGAGTALVFPTATNPLLGNGTFGIGPSVVALTQLGSKTMIGAVCFNVWSYARLKDHAATNNLALQYFVNHGLGKGWALATSPMITVNWRNSSGDRWVMPVGGGVNKVVQKKTMAFVLRLHAYAYAVKPSSSGSWQLMFSFEPIFPLK